MHVSDTAILDPSISKWHRRFLNLADTVSAWSKDPSTKVGCVLFNPETKAVLPSGYNGFPRGVQDLTSRMEDRDLKYDLTVHAETNALLACAREGIKTAGLGAATNFYPCAACAAALVQAGISIVLTYEPDWEHERWAKSFSRSRLILDEGGVTVLLFKTMVPTPSALWIAGMELLDAVVAGGFEPGSRLDTATSAIDQALADAVWTENPLTHERTQPATGGEL